MTMPGFSGAESLYNSSQYYASAAAHGWPSAAVYPAQRRSRTPRFDCILDIQEACHGDSVCFGLLVGVCFM